MPRILRYVVLFSILLFSTPVIAQPADLNEIFAKVDPAVVEIVSRVLRNSTDERPGSTPDQDTPSPEKRGSSLGSGFIISPAGIIVTNNHVIEGAYIIEVRLSDGRIFEGKLLGRDTVLDLAVIKIDTSTPLPVVQWGNSDDTKVGNVVFVIGNPFGLAHTLTAGVLSGKHRNIAASPFDDYLQTDASMNSGNSGGPLFNVAGEVIGINTAISTPSGGSVGLGFSVPSNLARAAVTELIAHGHLTRARLGIIFQPMTTEIAKALSLGRVNLEPLKVEEGVYVSGVQADSAASPVLKEGDIILSFNDTPLSKEKTLASLVAASPVGTPVNITFWREAHLVRASVTLKQAPLDLPLPTVNPPEQIEPDTLGMTLLVLPPEMLPAFGLSTDSKGLGVLKVAPGSFADIEGMREKDIIMSVDNKEPGSIENFKKLVKKAHTRGAVLLKVLRDKKVIVVGVKVG